jgi:catechol 1,2-dioxygenase
MKRRDFITATSLSAVAISASGFIRFDGERYIGDCATTSDILGPYYRPDSPVRSNLRIKGETGVPAELSGYVRHDDCSTPYKNAKLEIWHCDANGVYDNKSDEFKYRGTVFTDNKGFYSFQTIFPVAYAAPGFIRPAHYHLIITADGYQPLVTQLYFDGDEHIKGDVYASSPAAKKRILKVVKDSKGVMNVRYDVGMSKVLNLEVASIDKLTGKYVDANDKNNTAELFSYENKLWKKNEAFGNKFEYTGKNEFVEADNPPGFYWTLLFNLLPNGDTELIERYVDVDLSKKESRYLKAKT